MYISTDFNFFLNFLKHEKKCPVDTIRNVITNEELSKTSKQNIKFKNSTTGANYKKKLHKDEKIARSFLQQ